jgi:hypothetical protein
MAIPPLSARSGPGARPSRERAAHFPAALQRQQPCAFPQPYPVADLHRDQAEGWSLSNPKDVSKGLWFFLPKKKEHAIERKQIQRTNPFTPRNRMTSKIPRAPRDNELVEQGGSPTPSNSFQGPTTKKPFYLNPLKSFYICPRLAVPPLHTIFVSLYL